MILSLAPMADITHLGFRCLVASFCSPDLFFSEMIHSPSLLSGGHFEKWYIKTYSGENLVWQLTSNEVDTVKETIPILLQEGGLGIDLNMGCAAPHIVATGAGFAWVKKPKAEVKKLLENARCAIDKYPTKTLSVKLRLPSENYADLYDFCMLLVDCGVERITLHPRLQKERYTRCPHYEYIGKLSEALSIPVFGNGDIKTHDDIKKLKEKFPKVAGWMIGREVIKKPWFFLENETPIEIDLFNVASMFIQLLQEKQPNEFYLLRAKRFFSYFCDNFSFAHYIKTKVLNTKSVDEILPILMDYFNEVPQDKTLLLKGSSNCN
ncbi:MAG: tRNA-dihydrouridine synthase family protein [Treponema sp.]